jgi:alpha-tubulin suppressor-like RCC1 family protein
MHGGMKSLPTWLFMAAAACGGAKTKTPTGGGGDTPPPGPTGSLASVAAGGMFACVLDGGAARCWGELGDNTGMADALSPTAIGGDQRFAMISADGRTTCGVTDEGAGYCWGPNTDGQLGNGGADAGSKTPVKVKMPVVDGKEVLLASIAAGDPSSCGISKDGAAYCWGDNGYGQVGNGVASTDDVLAPTPVSGGLTFSTISVSSGFACGVTKTGDAYCWGMNSNGELGSGKPISGQTTDLSKVPSKVVGGHSWKTVATGQFHACGVTTAGAAYCWGQNNYQLGNGGSESSSTPVAVKGGHGFAKLDAGRHTTCGITTDNAAFCWGSNNLGELGNGTNEPQDLSRLPVAVVGGRAFADISVSSSEHVCAITTDRASVLCWGRNDHGQLGTGAAAASNTARSGTPTPVKL